MSRKKIIAGNWKMNKTYDEALNFIYEVSKNVPDQSLVDSVVCGQAPVLRGLVKRQGDHLRIGAQNMYFENTGAFTGEISPSLLVNIGVEYVILGHSERRQYFNETDETVNLKIKKALEFNLNPIVCVGEPLKIREEGTTDAFVAQQIEGAFSGLSGEQVKDLVIAYEPIWAIGTGKTCASDMANDTIKEIRNVVRRLYDDRVAESVRIQYGGSVKPSNVEELLSMSDIDGALVGGASLDPESFLTLVKAGIAK